MSSSSVPQSVAVESPPAAEDAVLALPGRSGPATRLISAAALGLAVLGLGWIVLTVYRAATDSFVAPTILSPDSDLVLTSKLRLGELAVERGRAVAEVESIDAEVEAAEAAVQRLVELRTTAEGGLGWMNRMASVKAGTQVADLKALGPVGIRSDNGNFSLRIQVPRR